MNETSMDFTTGGNFGNIGSGLDMQAGFGVLQVLSVGSNILYLVIFLATSYGLYKLSKKLGDEHSWIAFIPLIQIYTFIKTAGYTFGKGLLFLVLYSISGLIAAGIIVATVGFLFRGIILQSGNFVSIAIYGFFLGVISALVFIFVALFFLYSGMAKRAKQGTGTALLMTLFPWCMLYIVSNRIPDMSLIIEEESSTQNKEIQTEL